MSNQPDEDPTLFGAAKKVSQSVINSAAEWLREVGGTDQSDEDSQADEYSQFLNNKSEQNKAFERCPDRVSPSEGSAGPSHLPRTRLSATADTQTPYSDNPDAAASASKTTVSLMDSNNPPLKAFPEYPPLKASRAKPASQVSGGEGNRTFASSSRQPRPQPSSTALSAWPQDPLAAGHPLANEAQSQQPTNAGRHSMAYSSAPSASRNPLLTGTQFQDAPQDENDCCFGIQTAINSLNSPRLP